MNQPVEIRVTRHAYKRVKQRLDFKGKAAKRIVEQAWHRGTHGDQAPESLKEHIAYRSLRANGPAVYRIYSGALFCFSPDGTCLTVMKILPEHHS